jgi:hypothetical protein
LFVLSKASAAFYEETDGCIYYIVRKKAGKLKLLNTYQAGFNEKNPRKMRGFFVFFFAKLILTD